MSWKFWKKDKIESDDFEYDTVNYIFTKLFEKEFNKTPKKTMMKLLDESPLDYLHVIWKCACELSDTLYDKDIADELEVYFTDDGQFSIIVIELPEHDDYDVPYFIGLVFYQGYEYKCLIESEQLDWEFFVSEDEEEGCFIYRWEYVEIGGNKGEYVETGVSHELDAQSFYNALENYIENKLNSVSEGEPRLSFTEIDEQGNEVKTVLDFAKNRAKLDKIEIALDDLENDTSDIRFELKILSDELILKEFNKNPLMALQIFATPELYQELFTALYELACLDSGIEADFSILKQFDFEVYDGIISGPIVLITFPKPETLNECHYIAIAFVQGIEGHQVIDEDLVKFRYFSLEESIDECCLIEWKGDERANFGGEFIADDNEFLENIKRIVEM